MSIYTEENIFTYKENKYERLFDHPRGESYRIIFSEEDYDYIEDQETIDRLEEAFFIHSFGEEFMNSNDKGTKKMYQYYNIETR